MSNRETRRLILAVAVLREVSKGKISPDGQSMVLRLALMSLLPHVRKDALAQFWRCAGNDNAAQRWQQLRQVLEPIEADVRKAIVEG